MRLKDQYAVQPYRVGTKERKSLAIVIPSAVAKACKITTNSIFKLKLDEAKKRIVLEV